MSDETPKRAENTEKEASQEAVTKESPAPKAGGGLKILAGLSLGIALAALGALVLVWQGFLQMGGNDAGVLELEARLQSLETSTQNAEEARAQALIDLRAKLANLDASVQASDADASEEEVAAMAQEFEALKERLKQVEDETEPGARLDQEDLNQAQQELANMQRAIQGVLSHVETVDRNLAKSDVRLEALEENAPPDDLNGILNSLSAKSDVEALGLRLKSLEKYNTIEATEKATIALAAADLSEAAKGSAPFVTELDAFSIVSPGDNAARELRSFAISGVPTEGTLKSEFSLLVRQAIDAEKRAKAQGFWSRSWASFLTTFDVRKVGEVEGTSTKAIIARAEQRVIADDLDAAALELDALEGAAADVLGPWASQVTARTRVNALISKLNASVMSSLSNTLEAAGGR